MAMKTGVVTLAQEGRFQLVDDDGVGHLFVLSHAAAAEPSQLGELQRRQARVQVRCETAPNLIAQIAKSITLIGAPDEVKRA